MVSAAKPQSHNHHDYNNPNQMLTWGRILCCLQCFTAPSVDSGKSNMQELLQRHVSALAEGQVCDGQIMAKAEIEEEIAAQARAEESSGPELLTFRCAHTFAWTQAWHYIAPDSV